MRKTGFVIIVVLIVAAVFAWRQFNPGPLAFAGGSTVALADYKDTNPTGVPAGLAVLAIAQMGVHLVFFLHIDTGPDNTNNVLALAFGVLIAMFVVGGSLWIMANLNANMLPASVIMEMQR